MSQNCVAVRFHNVDQLIFQQDSASSHWGREIRNYINAKFSGHWIGKECPLPRLIRTFDITPVDLYSWKYVKDIV